MMLGMVDFDWKKFFLLAVPVALAVAILLVVLPRWQVEQIRGRLDKPADEYRLETLEAEHRRTLVQSIGGFLLFVGLYVAWRRVKATEENVGVAQKNVGVAQKNVGVAQENVRVAQENVRVAQEGQVTERFTRAIVQLGDDKMAIRLGGIYALERLAKDSEKDHDSIMEILTAYVREKATRQGKYAEEAAEKPPTDIQAILTVIGRRKPTDIKGLSDSKRPSGFKRLDDSLNLSNTHLAGVVLNDTNLSRVDLSGANLSGANLDGADLSMTNLDRADLSGAMMFRAKNLTGLQIQYAKNWGTAFLPDHLQYLRPGRPT